MRLRAAVVLSMFLIAGSVGAQTADPIPDAHESWLTRTLHRYFSNELPSGNDLVGQAVALADRYAKFSGRNIAVVLVHRVDRLRADDVPEDDLLSSFARALHPYTRENILRQYLLFQSGDTLDPLKLADSERLLREIEYVADVRLHVVPLTGEESSVAVVVEIRDRLPVGASLDVRDAERIDGRLFHSNIAGLDLRLAGDVFYRRGLTPEVGYRGGLRKRNLAGAFVDAEFGYEDSWRVRSRQASATRMEAHPDIRWVGGLSYQDRMVRDPAEIPRREEHADSWLGWVIPWRPAGSDGRHARTVLVPAVGFAKLSYRDRPFVAPDSNLSFQESNWYLTGVTISRLRHYRTSYLNGMGQTEDIAAGQGAKLTGVYEEGEFRWRTGVFAQAWYQSVGGRGDVLNIRLDAGTHLRNRVAEDGAVGASVSYVSRLRGAGGFQSRVLTGARYHRAVSPTTTTALTLADGRGPRAFDVPGITGAQRLVVDSEWRVFTPLVLYGFRFQVFGFADAAMIAQIDDPLLRQRVYTSTGLGLRIGNPDLVFPTMQVRLAMLGAIGDNAPGFVFEVRGFSAPATTLPGSRPGLFDFR